MYLWEIIDKRSQKTLKDVFNKALIIILIICFDGLIAFLKTFFFPTGDPTIEIIILLGNICAIFLMVHLVLMVIFERINDSYKDIKKMRLLYSKSHKIL